MIWTAEALKTLSYRLDCTFSYVNITILIFDQPTGKQIHCPMVTSTKSCVPSS